VRSCGSVPSTTGCSRGSPAATASTIAVSGSATGSPQPASPLDTASSTDSSATSGAANARAARRELGGRVTGEGTASRVAQ
jgi:hypothetical protein